MKALITAILAAVTIMSSAPAAAQSIHRREHRQEQRILAGKRNGSLAPGEARRLQQREVKLHRTEDRMRSRNGGYLNGRQRSRLNRMANRNSRAIGRLKHNGRHY